MNPHSDSQISGGQAGITVASGDDSEAFSSSPPTPRNDGPSSREKHRREVQRRWDARRVVGRFQQRYAESQPLWLTVDDLVVLSEWAAPSQLLGSVDLPPQETARLLDTLVRIIVLKEMPYNDYLQTDEWKGRAAATKERYGGRCALDASHQAEHAHHRTYDRRGRERDADLIPLCADCHAKFHNRRP